MFQSFRDSNLARMFLNNFDRITIFPVVLPSYGYFGGGTPGSRSTVDRIDYSNDTATASVRGPLSLSRYGLAATGNSSFGYFGAGGNSSTVDRIDYSNDTATAPAKGPLSAGRAYLSAASPTANGLPQ